MNLTIAQFLNPDWRLCWRAAHKPTGYYWAAVPQLSIVTLTAHNLASALPLLTSLWKNLEIGISAFLKVSRSQQPVSQFCLYDFMRLWVFLVCSALLVAARQGSLWQHRRSADTISSIHALDQFICNVRMSLAYYNCLILIKQYVYTLHVYMWCLTDRILHSMSV